MTTSKSQRRTAIPFLVLPWLILSGCGEEPEAPRFERVEFEGAWVISSAKLDGMTALEWEGHHLNFLQLKVDSGGYAFPAAPYDSIFPKSGGWKLIDTVTFQRSDGAFFEFYARDNGSLHMLMTADWLLTPYPCSADSVCPAAVLGTWMFELSKPEKTN